MEVTVVLEERYFVTPDNKAWSLGPMSYSFWKRYLEVFDSVRILARGIKVDNPPSGCIAATGNKVILYSIPDYHGPVGYLKRMHAVNTAVKMAMPKSGAVILRVPSHLGNCLTQHLRSHKYPFALEVVSDPYDVFAPGVIDHPLRAVFRWHFSRLLRKQCRDAFGVAYVTEKKLQERYPSRSMVAVSDVQISELDILSRYFSSYYSSVEISQQVEGCTYKVHTKHRYQIVTVGSLAQLYKGIDILISAIHQCVCAGLDVNAVVVGDGKYRPMLEAYALQEGMKERISFVGQVAAGKPVFDILDASDIFILPSRTEGLPRAMIEAMARGLPCIGTAVGGIPELLPSEDMVIPGDSRALASKIKEVLSNHLRMAEMSKRNVEWAKKYMEPVLAERRKKFYEKVRDYTLAWEAKR